MRGSGFLVVTFLYLTLKNEEVQNAIQILYFCNGEGQNSPNLPVYLWYVIHLNHKTEYNTLAEEEIMIGVERERDRKRERERERDF